MGKQETEMLKGTLEGIVLAIPWTTIGVFVVATIVAGVLAAILPARRASRLNILKALQYE